MKIYVRYRPRSLALVAGDNVLILRYSSLGSKQGQTVGGPSASSANVGATATSTSTGGNGSSTNTGGQNSNSGNGSSSESGGAKCIIDYTSRHSIDFDSYRELYPGDCYGFLGLINIESDVFLCMITDRVLVASPRPGETINRIHSVEFFCLNRADWDFLSVDVPANNLAGSNAQGSDYSDRLIGIQQQFQEQQILRQQQELTDQDSSAERIASIQPCWNLKRLLSDGTFYYSNDFELTCRMQDRSFEAPISYEHCEEGFMWNGYMMSELIKFQDNLRKSERDSLIKARFFTAVIRGFSLTVASHIGKLPIHLTMISRQSCRRAGTRFNARGLDDEGHVANFVESEVIINSEESSFSYVQIRGSVPVFWEQEPGLLSSKIHITRSLEATQPAFVRHFDPLVIKYGICHVVNLLSSKPGEADLTKRYEKQIRSATELQNEINYTHFDFHDAASHGGGFGAVTKVLRSLKVDLSDFGYFLYNEKSKVVECKQIGVMRTNCLDCLDRTNLVQQLISKYIVEMCLNDNGFGRQDDRDLLLKHSIIWADNGDQISRMYAGTGALKSSFTRSGKSSIAGAIADATKSVGRMYINNFMDKGRQNTLEILLGQQHGQTKVFLHDPINDYVEAELKKQISAFSSQMDITVYVATFNLNGAQSDVDLTPWLFPKGGISEPDLILVGFQEIVQLTAQQILSADPAKREFWEKKVLECLNKRGKYVLLRQGQLVGTALIMYCKRSKVQYMRNIEGSSKKTGLGGMAGNKGGVAFSCTCANTRLCFVTAHLAAGLQNYDDRNRDYKVIATSIRFSRNRAIRDHDTIIWLGDFNYRINMTNEQVRKCIEEKDWDKLYDKDQLNLQMLAGNTFPYYNEAPIRFPPTYKYDIGSQDYDTSEKGRIPAWCDRILSRGNNVKQLNYGSVDSFVVSDHRPVYATFNVTVTVINEEEKERLSRELYQKRRREVGDANELISLIDLNEQTLTNGLPPPSSDRHKWWIDGGQQAKVQLNIKPGQVINPQLPGNPFDSTKEPEIIGAPSLIDMEIPNRSQRFPTNRQISAPPPLPSRTSTSTSSNSSMKPSSDSARSLPPPALPIRPSGSKVSIQQKQQQQSRSPAIPPPLPTRPASSASSVKSGRRVPSTTKQRPAVPDKPNQLKGQHPHIAKRHSGALSEAVSRNPNATASDSELFRPTIESELMRKSEKNKRTQDLLDLDDTQSLIDDSPTVLGGPNWQTLKPKKT